MKSNLAVLSSNSVTRDGHQLSLESLEHGLWHSAPYGIPCNIAHDFHRPLGWMNPFGLYMEPGLVRTVGKMLIAETVEDQQRINEGRMSSLISQSSRLMTKYGDVFRPTIEEHLTNEAKYIDCNALAYVDQGILEKKFPEFVNQKDNDGLVSLKYILNDFLYKGQGIFAQKKGNLVIFAHPYLRRSLSRHNNFHFIFLDELVKQVANKNVTVKIALDSDMIGYTPSVSTAFEFEYWWGPKFDNDISKIEVGLTRHQCSEFERHYYGISSTEFFWKEDGDLHEFELEELKEDPVPSFSSDNYGCRYVHSIYDKSKKTFVHFDGAIRMYTGDLMLERIDKKMTEFGRRSAYTKLFRIDGALELSKWKSLVTNYLQGNPLIYEYFGLEKPKGPEVLSKEIKSLKQKYVPFSIDQGDGIRVMLSYHVKNECTDTRTVSIVDQISDGEKERSFIEYDIVEFKKALKRLNADLNLPNDVTFGYAEDLYWNIPCIFHGNPNPQSDIDTTLKAFKNIVQSLSQKGMEKVISFTFSWNEQEKEIRISVLGHSEDLSKWVSTFDSVPSHRNDLIKWLDSQNKYLDGLTHTIDKPELFELSQFDGVLYIKRRNVQAEFGVNLKPTPEGVLFSLEVPNSRTDISDALSNGTIKPSLSFLCESSTCTLCEKEYWNCEHSYILDSNIGTRPQSKVFGTFWTDRSAF